MFGQICLCGSKQPREHPPRAFSVYIAFHFSHTDVATFRCWNPISAVFFGFEKPKWYILHCYFGYVVCPHCTCFVPVFPNLCLLHVFCSVSERLSFISKTPVKKNTAQHGPMPVIHNHTHIWLNMHIEFFIQNCHVFSEKPLVVKDLPQMGESYHHQYQYIYIYSHRVDCRSCWRLAMSQSPRARIVADGDNLTEMKLYLENMWEYRR